MHNSTHGPGCCSCRRFLPVATPYSQRLAQLFDRLHLKPGARCLAPLCADARRAGHLPAPLWTAALRPTCLSVPPAPRHLQARISTACSCSGGWMTSGSTCSRCSPGPGRRRRCSRGSSAPAHRTSLGLCAACRPSDLPTPRPLPSLVSLPPVPCMQAEVEELFKVVDVEGKGAVGQAELAAGLIDWKAFEVGGGRQAGGDGRRSTGAGRGHTLPSPAWTVLPATPCPTVLAPCSLPPQYTGHIQGPVGGAGAAGLC